MKALITAIKDRIQGKVPLFSKRSSRWPTVREHYVKANPICAACGSKEKLQVHHIKPFHIDPSLELDPKNLFTLCESKGRECHLKVGHLGNFKKENPLVREQAEALRKSLPA